MASIRHARPEDASAIAAVWNPVIRDTVATFNKVERRPEDIRRMMESRAEQDHPWLVAETDAGIVGFATYAQFREGVGYAHTMEHTIILGDAATGQGLGPQLMERLVAEARERGVHSLIAAVSAENEAGVAFHDKMGFREVGRIPEAGRKFERWFDLVLMQRIL